MTALCRPLLVEMDQGSGCSLQEEDSVEEVEAWERGLVGIERVRLVY